MCTVISNLIVFHPANDPLSYSIVEGDGTPVPRPLLSVVASDLDGDTITYAINPASVSMIRLRPASECDASKQCVLDAVPRKNAMVESISILLLYCFEHALSACVIVVF